MASLSNVKARENRSFHIIVWGATGFTGSLIAEYLAQNAPKSLKWAIAGRSKDKLQQVERNILMSSQTSKKIETVIASLSSPDSIDAMVADTRVIISAVGPYYVHGLPIVDACVRLNTDYVDITGEPAFVHAVIEKYHTAAIANKTIIVPCCGFDSMPSDLGTYMIVKYIKEIFEKDTVEVRNSLMKLRGGFSGGTLATVALQMELPFSSLMKLRDPFLFNDKDYKPVKARSRGVIFYDEDLKRWQSPFFMETINGKIVRRSQSLLGSLYGDKFVYNESWSQSNLFMAILNTIIFLFGIIILIFPPTRWLIVRIFPSGYGPSEDVRKSGFFTYKSVGVAEGGLQKAIATISGISDPGYGETCKMVAEAGLALAIGRDSLSVIKEGRSGGVLTPASAFGDVLLDRLRKAGMVFHVETYNRS